MEPDISDQFESIEAFIAWNLSRMQDADQGVEDTRAKKQVNVRLPVHVHEKLAVLASDTGMSTTALATALLELAIARADGVTLTGSAAKGEE